MTETPPPEDDRALREVFDAPDCYWRSRAFRRACSHVMATVEMLDEVTLPGPAFKPPEIAEAAVAAVRRSAAASRPVGEAVCDVLEASELGLRLLRFTRDNRAWAGHGGREGGGQTVAITAAEALNPLSALAVAAVREREGLKPCGREAARIVEQFRDDASDCGGSLGDVAAPLASAFRRLLNRLDGGGLRPPSAN